MASDRVRVWDRFVRCFHWSLAGLFVLAYLIGEDPSWLHTWAGYAILALIAMRVIWGFIGPEHARFRSFLRGPASVARYLKGLLTNRAPRYLGHNPAGGWMVVALLLTLTATGASGLIVYGLEGGGPLAGQKWALQPAVWVVGTASATGNGAGEEGEHEAAREHEVSHEEDEEGGGGDREAMASANEPGYEAAEEIWEGWHAWLADLAVVLVLVHIAGVMASSLAHRENLLRAMITGDKPAN